MLIGDSTVWLKPFQDINDRILLVIKDIWPDCASRFNCQSLENKITDQLAVMLQRSPCSRSNWLIIPQYKSLDKDFNGDVVTKGFIDFVVFITLDQEVYIAYECKRLNVKFPSGFKSLADKYIDEGVMRYISAQYAQGLPFSVMIGYVLDNDIPIAIDAISKQIKKKAGKLCCNSNPKIKKLPAVSFIRRFSTFHNRPEKDIEIQHLLLPLHNLDWL